MAQTGTYTSPEAATGGVPKGAKTSDYYKVQNIPSRFDNPGKCYSAGNPIFSCTVDVEAHNTAAQNIENSEDSFQGYRESTSAHPMYRTSSSSYGARKPTVHTMPTTFHAKCQKFSEHLGNCGMYRNHSLNCAQDKNIAPDH